jgi:hypothetical protein
VSDGKDKGKMFVPKFFSLLILFFLQIGPPAFLRRKFLCGKCRLRQFKGIIVNR